MAYIGNIPAVQYASFSKQTLTADSSTTSFTLDNAVANENEIEVFVNNVRQEPGSGNAYTASGTTLTMSAAPTTGDSFYVIFQGKATQTVTAPAGSVTTSQLADSSVSLAKLTATGTKDATTFLRGDNTFAGGGKVLQVVSATDNTQRSTTSGTYVTGSNTLSVNITPSATSSKILVMFSSNARSATDDKEARYTIFRDSTDLSGGNGTAFVNKNDSTSISSVIVDSPSTTSQLTYQVYMKAESGFTIYLNHGSTFGTIVAMEIGA